MFNSSSEGCSLLISASNGGCGGGVVVVVPGILRYSCACNQGDQVIVMVKECENGS